ncbi:hypothetical protein BH09MYX1_BH09MYX1_61620 [soil metagenome]
MSTRSMGNEVVSVRASRRLVLLTRIARAVDYAFGVLYVLFVVRLALEFLRANHSAGFFKIIAAMTDPFYAPFKAIVATHSLDGAPIVWPLVIAIVGYMLLHAAIRGLLRLIARG